MLIFVLKELQSEREFQKFSWRPSYKVLRFLHIIAPLEKFKEKAMPVAGDSISFWDHIEFQKLQN